MKKSSPHPHVVVLILASFLAVSILPGFAKISEEERVVNEKRRAEIPFGGKNLQPRPEEGIFIAAGHSGNILVSRDDGKTWQQSFYGEPCGDHGYWTVWDTVAYTEGIFCVAMGWGRPGTWLATDDGKTWHHLTGPDREPRKKDDPAYTMKTTMRLIGVDGRFIAPFVMTPDFGKTWFESSQWGLEDENGERVKVDAHHSSLAYGQGPNGPRLVVVSSAGPYMYSDDMGKTWIPRPTDLEGWEGRGAKGIVAKGDVFLAFRGPGETAWRSTDGGDSWEVAPVGVKDISSRSFGLNVIGDEFWITGNELSRASKDGLNWRDLPEGFPAGRLAVSDQGTLISVSRKRHNILRSEDGGETWEKVYTFQPHPEAAGGAQGLGGIAWGKVKAVK